MAGGTGAGDVPRLIELRRALASKDPATRRAGLLEVEPGWGMEQAVAEALSDHDPEVRRASVQVLATIDGALGTRALIRASSGDLSPAVRRDAVIALGRILSGWSPPEPRTSEPEEQASGSYDPAGSGARRAPSSDPSDVNSR